MEGSLRCIIRTTGFIFSAFSSTMMFIHVFIVVIPTLVKVTYGQHQPLDYLYVEDICAAPIIAPLPVRYYQKAFIQTPRSTSGTNTYPANSSCSLTICMTSINVLVELQQFNIPAESNGNCLDYIMLDSRQKLCNANLQGLTIPLRTQNNCFQVEFHSNEDSVFGSGAKIRVNTDDIVVADIVGLSTATGIYEVCGANVQAVQAAGLLMSPSYPSIVYGHVDCTTTYHMPRTCHLLNVDFLDFYTSALNFVVINNVVYSQSMSGFSVMLNVSTSNTLMITMKFMYPSKIAEQRALLRYSCKSHGTLLSIMQPHANPISQSLQPIYISSGLDRASVTSPTSDGMLRYEISLATKRNLQSMFYLKAWRAHSSGTIGCDAEPMSVLINGQNLCGKGGYTSLRTSGSSFTVEMTMPAYEVERINDFILLYQDGIEGIYDICRQSQLEPLGTGFITSPGYPINYQRNLNCSITIINNARQLIEIEFLDFETEKTTNTGRDHDYLNIINMDDNNNQKFDGDSSTPRPNILSQSKNLRLNFVTDDLNQKKGFMLRYTVTADLLTTISQQYPVSTTTSTPPTSFHSPISDLTTTSQTITTNSTTRANITVVSESRSGGDDFTDSILFFILIGVIAALVVFIVSLVCVAICRRKKTTSHTMISDEEVLRTIYAPSPRRERLTEMYERTAYGNIHTNGHLNRNTAIDQSSWISEDRRSLTVPSQMSTNRRQSQDTSTQYDPPSSCESETSSLAKSTPVKRQLTRVNAEPTLRSSMTEPDSRVVLSPIALKPTPEGQEKGGVSNSSPDNAGKLPLKKTEMFSFKPIETSTVWTKIDKNMTEQSTESELTTLDQSATTQLLALNNTHQAEDNSLAKDRSNIASSAHSTSYVTDKNSKQDAEDNNTQQHLHLQTISSLPTTPNFRPEPPKAVAPAPPSPPLSPPLPPPPSPPPVDQLAARPRYKPMPVVATDAFSFQTGRRRY